MRRLILLLIAIACSLAGCFRASIMERSDTAGFNGGFEVEKSGLPVNWYVHNRPINSGAVEISLDTTDAVEGNEWGVP